MNNRFNCFLSFIFVFIVSFASYNLLYQEVIEADYQVVCVDGKCEVSDDQDNDHETSLSIYFTDSTSFKNILLFSSKLEFFYLDSHPIAPALSSSPPPELV